MTSYDLFPTSDRFKRDAIRFSAIENMGVDTKFTELAAFVANFEASRRLGGGVDFVEDFHTLTFDADHENTPFAGSPKLPFGARTNLSLRKKFSDFTFSSIAPLLCHLQS